MSWQQGWLCKRVLNVPPHSWPSGTALLPAAPEAPDSAEGADFSTGCPSILPFSLADQLCLFGTATTPTHPAFLPVPEVVASAVSVGIKDQPQSSPLTGDCLPCFTQVLSDELFVFPFFLFSQPKAIWQVCSAREPESCDTN